MTSCSCCKWRVVVVVNDELFLNIRRRCGWCRVVVDDDGVVVVDDKDEDVVVVNYDLYDYGSIWHILWLVMALTYSL